MISLIYLLSLNNQFGISLAEVPLHLSSSNMCLGWSWSLLMGFQGEPVGCVAWNRTPEWKGWNQYRAPEQVTLLPNESYLQHLFWISPVFGSFYSKISRFPKRMAICPPILPTKPPGVPPVFNGPFPQVGSEERRAAGDPWTGTLSEHVAGTPAEMGSPSQSVHWWGCWQCTLWSFNSSPWKITMLWIGKPSISMAIYTMAMLNNQRATDLPMIIII